MVRNSQEMSLPIREYVFQLNQPKVRKKGVRFQIDLFKTDISAEAYIEALKYSGFDTLTFSAAEFGTKPNSVGKGSVLAGTFDIYLHEEGLPRYGPDNYRDDDGNLLPILYPPPKVRLLKADGTSEFRTIRKVGACRYCYGPHHPPREVCPYQGRCNRCLAVIKRLPHEGFHHFCTHDLISEPNPAKTATPSSRKNEKITPSNPMSDRRKQRLAQRAMKRQLDIQAAIDKSKEYMAPASPQSEKSGRSSKSQKLVRNGNDDDLTEHICRDNDINYTIYVDDMPEEESRLEMQTQLELLNKNTMTKTRAVKDNG